MDRTQLSLPPGARPGKRIFRCVAHITVWATQNIVDDLRQRRLAGIGEIMAGPDRRPIDGYDRRQVDRRADHDDLRIAPFNGAAALFACFWRIMPAGDKALRREQEGDRGAGLRHADHIYATAMNFDQ